MSQVEVTEETIQTVQSTWDTVKQIPDVTAVAGELLFRK